MIARIEHVHGVPWRHVVLDRVGLNGTGESVRVRQRRQFGSRQGGTGNHHTGIVHFAGRKRHQEAARSIPEGIRRGDTPVQRRTESGVEGLGRGLRLTSGAGHSGGNRIVLVGVVRRIDDHERAAAVGTVQRHQVGTDLPRVGPGGIHVARVQEAVAIGMGTVEHEHVGAIRIDLEYGEPVAVGDVLPAREHDRAIGTDNRIAIVALVEGDLRDRTAVGRHGVQVEYLLAFVFVQGNIAAAQGLIDRTDHLAVGREHETRASGQVGRTDIVSTGRIGDATEGSGRQAIAGVVFPDVPAAGAGGNRRAALRDLRGVARGAVHREHHLAAVVRDFRVGDVSDPLGNRPRQIDFGGAGRGGKPQHQVASGREGRPRQRIEANRIHSLGIDKRHIAGQCRGVDPRSAAAGAQHKGGGQGGQPGSACVGVAHAATQSAPAGCRTGSGSRRVSPGEPCKAP